jgi:hypothetical protein
MFIRDDNQLPVTEYSHQKAPKKHFSGVITPTRNFQRLKLEDHDTVGYPRPRFLTLLSIFATYQLRKEQHTLNVARHFLRVT